MSLIKTLQSLFAPTPPRQGEPPNCAFTSAANHTLATGHEEPQVKARLSERRLQADRTYSELLNELITALSRHKEATFVVFEGDEFAKKVVQFFEAKSACFALHFNRTELLSSAAQERIEQLLKESLRHMGAHPAPPLSKSLPGSP